MLDHSPISLWLRIMRMTLVGKLSAECRNRESASIREQKRKRSSPKDVDSRGAARLHLRGGETCPPPDRERISIKLIAEGNNRNRGRSGSSFIARMWDQVRDAKSSLRWCKFRDVVARRRRSTWIGMKGRSVLVYNVARFASDEAETNPRLSWILDLKSWM